MLELHFLVSFLYILGLHMSSINRKSLGHKIYGQELRIRYYYIGSVVCIFAHIKFIYEYLYMEEFSDIRFMPKYSRII